MNYCPGLHILLTIHCPHNGRLKDADQWLQFIKQVTEAFGLQNLGEVRHTFENSGGFTAVHCLTESHISIHTWPEHGLCTCDVYLSNFMRNNRPTVKHLANAITRYFDAQKVELKEIER